MNKTIEIQVKDKIAKNMTPEIVYVCGNSDYNVKFAFDEDWVENAKTARFSYDNGLYLDVPFNGDECAFPKILSAMFVNVGVYAGDLRTSTDAYVSARKGALSKGGTPADPAPDVYNQIMEQINAGMLKGEQGEKGEKGEKGADGKDGKDGEAILYCPRIINPYVGMTYLTSFSSLSDIGTTPRVGDLIVDAGYFLYQVKTVYAEHNACDLYCLTCLKGEQGEQGEKGDKGDKGDSYPWILDNTSHETPHVDIRFKLPDEVRKAFFSQSFLIGDTHYANGYILTPQGKQLVMPSLTQNETLATKNGVQEEVKKVEPKFGYYDRKGSIKHPIKSSGLYIIFSGGEALKLYKSDGTAVVTGANQIIIMTVPYTDNNLTNRFVAMGMSIAKATILNAVPVNGIQVELDEGSYVTTGDDSVGYAVSQMVKG